MKERDRGSHRLAFPQQKLFPYPPSRYHLCGKNPLSLLFIPSASPLLFSLLFSHLPFPLRRRFGPNGNDKGRGKGKISTWRTVQKRGLGWAGSAVEGHHTCLASNMVVFSEEKVRWSFFLFLCSPRVSFLIPSLWVDRDKSLSGSAPGDSAFSEAISHLLKASGRGGRRYDATLGRYLTLSLFRNWP